MPSLLVVALLSACIPFLVHAQVVYRQPALRPRALAYFAKHGPLSRDYPSYSLSPYLNNSLFAQEVAHRKPFFFGKAFDVQLTQQDGAWLELPVKVASNEPALALRLWRLAMRSPRAHSLNLLFDDFELSERAELYVHSLGHEDAIVETRGPFTALNNKVSHAFATAPLEGNALLLELYEPVYTNEEPESTFIIKRLVHGFVDQRKDRSSGCNINVACDGNQRWANEVRATAMLMTQGGQAYCSGAMINNLRGDRRQLFLTAYHCVEDGGAIYDMVMFNYQAEFCDARDAPRSPQTAHGMDVLAEYYQSDYALMELSETIPREYNVYLAGWSAELPPYTPASPVGIHHPRGDIKKISHAAPNITATCWGDACRRRQAPNHWRVNQWAQGTTEGGSSGSPLFDYDTKRLVGQLHGGSASCFNRDIGWDEYGQLAISYDRGHDDLKLADFLDPEGTGQRYCDGKDFPKLLTLHHAPRTTSTTATSTSSTQYRLLETLGKGQYAKVMLAEDVASQPRRRYAIKIISLKRMARRGSVLPGSSSSALDAAPSASSSVDSLTDPLLLVRQSIDREVDIMRRVLTAHHPNIVGLLSTSATASDVYLLMEYLPGGEVPWQLSDDYVLSVPRIKQVVVDVLNGLAYMHARGVIHRDLKPNNLTMDSRGRVKIVDFGSAIYHSSLYEEGAEWAKVGGDAAPSELTPPQLERELERWVGSPLFYAPELCQPPTLAKQALPSFVEKPRQPRDMHELLFGGGGGDDHDEPHHPTTATPPRIGKPIDMWALGITLYCLLFHQLPYQQSTSTIRSEFDLMKLIRSLREMHYPVSDDRRGVFHRVTGECLHIHSREHAEQPDLMDLLDGILCVDPGQRLTAREARYHESLMDVYPGRTVEEKRRLVSDMDAERVCRLINQGKDVAMPVLIGGSEAHISPSPTPACCHGFQWRRWWSRVKEFMKRPFKRQGVIRLPDQASPPAAHAPLPLPPSLEPPKRRANFFVGTDDDGENDTAD